MIRNLFAKTMLVARTISYMKPSQIAFFALRRGAGYHSVPTSTAPAPRRNFGLAPPLSSSDIATLDAEFQFLNREIKLGDSLERISWQPDAPRLWLYHLHYFDLLRQDDITNELKKAHIEDWIEQNPPGSEPGWEPYTASLRIVNWVFWFAQNPELVSQDMRDSLWQQLRWLDINDERHILANHYFENIKALIFGCSYFTGTFSEERIAHWQRKLREQLDEQFFADGGHYERAPHYHALMTENLLDLLNLDSHNTLLTENNKRAINQRSQKALGFLDDITYPDGKLPLFGDGGVDDAPSTETLHRYASTLGLEAHRTNQAPRLINLQHTGYFGLRTADDMILISCGQFGPRYQPGHAHCDGLSFELVLNKQRVIVDSGNYGYENDEARKYFRSTAAHNTVQINGGDQAEVWSAFRAGRRPEARSSNIRWLHQNQCATFTGKVNWPSDSAQQIQHVRSVEITLDENLGISNVNIEDHPYTSYSEAKAESAIHFHPSITLKHCQQYLTATTNTNTQLSIHEIPNTECSIDCACYAPSFGEHFGTHAYRSRTEANTVSRTLVSIEKNR